MVIPQAYGAAIEARTSFLSLGKQRTQMYHKKPFEVPLEVVRNVDAAVILDEQDLLSKAREF